MRGRAPGPLITAAGLRDGRPKRKYDAALYEGVAGPQHRCERRLRRPPPPPTAPRPGAAVLSEQAGSSECRLAVPLTGLAPGRNGQVRVGQRLGKQHRRRMSAVRAPSDRFLFQLLAAKGHSQCE